MSRSHPGRAAQARSQGPVKGQRAPVRPARLAAAPVPRRHVLAWLAPLLWAMYAALRPYAETSTKGYVSWPDKLSLANFTNAFTSRT